jgi:hypothetical protein
MDPQEAHLRSGMLPTDPAYGVELPERWGRLYGYDGTEAVVPALRGHYGEFYRQFRAAVLGSGPVPVEPAQSMAVLRLLDAVEAAGATGSAQNV